MISIVDLGIGNLGSIPTAFRRVGVPSAVTSNHQDIRAAEALVLPGVGAYDPAAASLDGGMRELLLERVADGVPLVGICLGMQLLAEGSDEGVLPGLGLIPGRATKIAENGAVRVPHMGWNTLTLCREDPLIHAVEDDTRFYFAHSYVVSCDDPADVLAHADHGGPFAAIVRRGSVTGIQFHPEKSHGAGVQLLKAWVDQWR